jgi:acetoacetyl-CoA synthetase
MSPPIPRKLWEHPAPETTEMFKFKRSLEQKTGVTLKVYFVTFPTPQKLGCERQ